jgi:hypothetical protein
LIISNSCINREDDPPEFLTISSIILTHLEIEFSKCKHLKDLRKKLLKRNSKKVADSFIAPDEMSPSQVGTLIFNLQELEFHVDKFLNQVDLTCPEGNENDKKLFEVWKYFQIRSNIVVFIKGSKW